MVKFSEGSFKENEDSGNNVMLDNLIFNTNVSIVKIILYHWTWKENRMAVYY